MFNLKGFDICTAYTNCNESIHDKTVCFVLISGQSFCKIKLPKYFYRLRKKLANIFANLPDNKYNKYILDVFIFSGSTELTTIDEVYEASNINDIIVSPIKVTDCLSQTFIDYQKLKKKGKDTTKIENKAGPFFKTMMDKPDLKSNYSGKYEHGHNKYVLGRYFKVFQWVDSISQVSVNRILDFYKHDICDYIINHPDYDYRELSGTLSGSPYIDPKIFEIYPPDIVGYRHSNIVWDRDKLSSNPKLIDYLSNNYFTNWEKYKLGQNPGITLDFTKKFWFWNYLLPTTARYIKVEGFEKYIFTVDYGEMVEYLLRKENASKLLESEDFPITYKNYLKWNTDLYWDMRKVSSIPEITPEFVIQHMDGFNGRAWFMTKTFLETKLSFEYIEHMYKKFMSDDLNHYFIGITSRDGILSVPWMHKVAKGLLIIYFPQRMIPYEDILTKLFNNPEFITKYMKYTQFAHHNNVGKKVQIVYNRYRQFIPNWDRLLQ
jgi:hypothetical protein